MADIFDSRIIPTSQLIAKDGWQNDSTPALSEQNLDNNQEALWHLIENNNKFFNTVSGTALYNNIVNDDSNNIWTWYNTVKSTVFITHINGVAVQNPNVVIDKQTVGLGNIENVSHENLTVGYARKLLSAIGNADFDNTSTLLSQGNSYTPVYFSSGVATNCSITNSSSATALGTNQKLITERAVYYGLPTINGLHNYNSGTNLYAPTSAGTTGQILRSAGSGSPSWESPTDNSSATALVSTSTKAITERAVYYGLPTINDAHNYTSSTKIYAVTSKGTSGQVLTSQGTAALAWTNQSALTVGAATKATQDGNGNNIVNTYCTKANAITGITFNSNGTVTITKGNGTTSTQNVTALTAIGPIVTAVVSSTAPTNTAILWIDSGNGYILKVHNGTNWIAPRSVWGG